MKLKRFILSTIYQQAKEDPFQIGRRQIRVGSCSLRIEKSTYENIYFVHLFGDFDTCSLIEEAIKISDKDIYEGLDLEISIITHEDIEGIWYRKSYTQIYYTSPEQFLD